MNEFMKYGFGNEPLPIPKQADMVNKPPHYNFGKYEVLDVIEDWNLDYHLGNVVKYIARAEHKGNKLQDLEKAKFYLDRYIKKEGEKLCEEID